MKLCVSFQNCLYQATTNPIHWLSLSEPCCDSEAVLLLNTPQAKKRLCTGFTGLPVSAPVLILLDLLVCHLAYVVVVSEMKIYKSQPTLTSFEQLLLLFNFDRSYRNNTKLKEITEYVCHLTTQSGPGCLQNQVSTSVTVEVSYKKQRGQVTRTKKKNDDDKDKQ